MVPFHTNFYQNFHANDFSRERAKRTIFYERTNEQNERSKRAHERFSRERAKRYDRAHRDTSTQNRRRDLYGARGSKLSTSLKTKWSDVTDVSPRT